MNIEALIKEYMSYPYPMSVIPDTEEGGYTISFPDLPGCVTCVGSLNILEQIVEDVKREWFKAAIEEGIEIRLPQDASVKSGKGSHLYVYPAVFRNEDNGSFSVSFPDIDGCFTCGDSLEDAMFMAKDALSLMLRSEYEDKGLSVPNRTHINHIKHDENEFVTYIMCDTTKYQLP